MLRLPKVTGSWAWMEGAVWKVEDAMEGRLTLGKARDGRTDEEYLLRISGKRLFQLQKFLEEAAAKPADFFDGRMAVMLWEEIRRGILNVGAPEPPPGGVSGE